MSSAASPRRAALYLRISLDQTGEGLAIDRQRKECQRIARQRRWRVVDEYVDNSISASDARKNRPGYDALVKAYEAGEFDALICYDMDRLTRQPRQMEDWIDAAEKRGLDLVTANGECDLQTDAGQTFARVRMAFALGEVKRKSARQRAAAVQRADTGRPPLGVRLTGYTPKGQTVSDEAKIVRQIFALFHGGESLRGIVRTLTEGGHATRNGKPWNPSTIRDILVNPRYAGRAVYNGEPNGKRGNWEALVSEDVFDAVQARLTDPRRATNRVGTDRKHLGSGLFVCDVCSSPVVSFSGGRYRCKSACVNRAHGPVDNQRVRQIISEVDGEPGTAPLARGVDEFVTAVLAERLSRPDTATLLAPAPADTAPLRDEIAALRARLANFENDYAEGVITGRQLREASEKVTAALAKADRELRALVPGGTPLGGVLTAPDPASAFLDASLMGRRSVIDALCEVRLMRGSRGSKTFDHNTVRIQWRA